MACTTNLSYHYTISLPRHAEHFGDEHELPVVKMKVEKLTEKDYWILEPQELWFQKG